MTDAPIDLRIERLRLQAQGLDEGSARQLARLVAENLAGDLRLAGASAALATMSVERPSLSVEVPARPGEAVDETARRIAETIRRAVARPGS